MADRTIRTATTRDVPRIVDLRLAFLEEVGRPVDDDLRRAIGDYLARAIPSGDCVFWVVETGDEGIVAIGAMCIYERMMWNGVGREGYVLSMYTEPHWRGRGIAAEIIEHMQTFAREERLKLCLISVDEARPVYERAGFEADHRYMRWR
jgi:GNAT superfamily N-acetyltransferase